MLKFDIGACGKVKCGVKSTFQCAGGCAPWHYSLVVGIEDDLLFLCR